MSAKGAVPSGFGVILLSAATASLGSGCRRMGEDGRTTALLQEPWKVAVVFQIQHGTRRYIGCVMRPVLRQVSFQCRPVATASNDLKGSGGHEIWLARDSKTLGLWIPSGEAGIVKRGQSGSVQRPGIGSVAHFIASSGSWKAEGVGRPPDATGIADFPPPPESLSGSCAGSDVVVVGRIAAILRNAHSPMEARCLEQHTVYVVAVEEFLKSGGSGSPGIVKVWVSGGSLPYEDFAGGRGGVGLEIKNDPLLKVGERCILFLQTAASEDARRRGYVHAAVKGVSGKDGELDEYIVTEPWRGKVLLQAGLTCPPRVTGNPAMDKWSFEHGPSITGIREAEAISLIREYAQDRGRHSDAKHWLGKRRATTHGSEAAASCPVPGSEAGSWGT